MVVCPVIWPGSIVCADCSALLTTDSAESSAWSGMLMPSSRSESRAVRGIPCCSHCAIAAGAPNKAMVLRQGEHFKALIMSVKVGKPFRSPQAAEDASESVEVG